VEKKKSVRSHQGKSFVCQTETWEPAAFFRRQDFRLAGTVLLLLCRPTFDRRSLSVLVAYGKLHQQPPKMAAKLLNLRNSERLLLPHLLVLIHATMPGWMCFPGGARVEVFLIVNSYRRGLTPFALHQTGHHTRLGF